YSHICLSYHLFPLLFLSMIRLPPTSTLFPYTTLFRSLRWFPFGGMVQTPPPQGTLPYALSVLKHLVLPASSIVISAIFYSIYSWRTFFLIYSSEDYVEMAKAKGLTSAAIERRYILRPTLPTIITSFALTIISLWTGSIVLERVFNWPGLGQLIYRAICTLDTHVT